MNAKMKLVSISALMVIGLFLVNGAWAQLPKQKSLNLQFVFDASGSMAGRVSGESKIVAARRAIGYVIDSLPEDGADINVGFRVFGHAGDNSEAGRALSCRSTELKVPMSGLNKWQLMAETAAYQPTGWTPISLALTAAGGDFAKAQQGRNVVILVTDGEETCFGDPCAAAAALAQANVETVVHVIGFDLNLNTAATLRCIPQNTNGLYLDARDGDALAAALLGLIGEEVRASGHPFKLSEDIVGRITIPAIDLSASLNAATKATRLGLEAGKRGLQLGEQAIDLGQDVLKQSENLLDHLGIKQQTAKVNEESITIDQAQHDSNLRQRADNLRNQAQQLRQSVNTGNIKCASNENCACGPGTDCRFTCPSGNCVMSCATGSNCNFKCSGGNCDMSCGAGSNCNFKCPGGNCDTTCGQGSSCRTHCAGGNCTAIGSIIR